MSEHRLQKILAAVGVDSDRKCEELILEEAVRVNRKIVDQLPAFAGSITDVIAVNVKKIHAEQKIYYLLNKLISVICTSRDPGGRKKAIDLVHSVKRIFCVGRFEAEATRINILTNDSKLANRISHPRYNTPKTYVARIKGQVVS